MHVTSYAADRRLSGLHHCGTLGLASSVRCTGGAVLRSRPTASPAAAGSKAAAQVPKAFAAYAAVRCLPPYGSAATRGARLLANAAACACAGWAHGCSRCGTAARCAGVLTAAQGTLCGGGAVRQRLSRSLSVGSLVVVGALPSSGAPDASAGGAAFSSRRQKLSRRRRSSGDACAGSPVPAGASGVAGGGASGGASPSVSPVSSPAASSVSTIGGGGGTVAAAAAATAVAVTSMDTSVGSGGSDSEYDDMAAPGGTAHNGNHIVPFVRRQPRALVLDCAYRPINVITWYKAFHLDYFGRGEVLEYYPPPAVCTTGMGEFPLPAVLRVPQYTADVQDLCSRVACTRRNIMVRDGFCCQYCGSRRDLTIDHVHPASRGGGESWDNLVTACMRCNQRKSDKTLRELGWKLKRVPKEPTPFEIGIVAGISTSDILRPPPEWELYIGPYRERLETYRRAAVEAGLANLMESD